MQFTTDVTEPAGAFTDRIAMLQYSLEPFGFGAGLYYRWCENESYPR